MQDALPFHCSLDTFLVHTTLIFMERVHTISISPSGMKVVVAGNILALPFDSGDAEGVLLQPSKKTPSIAKGRSWRPSKLTMDASKGRQSKAILPSDGIRQYLQVYQLRSNNVSLISVNFHIAQDEPKANSSTEGAEHCWLFLMRISFKRLYESVKTSCLFDFNA